MTKAELQTALAKATQTNKKIAGIFLDTLSAIAYKTAKKDGEFVVPGFGKLVKQKRKARTGTNPSTKQKIKIPARTVIKFRVFKVAKDAITECRHSSGLAAKAFAPASRIPSGLRRVSLRSSQILIQFNGIAGRRAHQCLQHFNVVQPIFRWKRNGLLIEHGLSESVNHVPVLVCRLE